MSNNGDIDKTFKVGTDDVKGLGSFHKSLPHDSFGEVDSTEYQKLVDAAETCGKGYQDVPVFKPDGAPLINPQAGLARDRLTPAMVSFSMPPAPHVLSISTAAEMTELYWMAILRDESFDNLNGNSNNPDVQAAANEIDMYFRQALLDGGDPGRLKPGIDVPGSAANMDPITPQNLFRLGLPDEDKGPLISQFFIRDVNYGTQLIDQQQLPYAEGKNYLTQYSEWLNAQNTGQGADGNDYRHANEAKSSYYGSGRRYISTLRDLARFVNKDALHQAYFNAAMLLLSGDAKWTPGNPYRNKLKRETGFGTLGGPHILALVSEVATRALKIVWHQKWQVHLRLRPEAYGGLVHVQTIGAPNGKRAYGLPSFVANSNAAQKILPLNQIIGQQTLLLPMAYTSGSPTHPAYGAGHATVAGACVTVLKAFFEVEHGIQTLMPRPNPWDPPMPFATFVTGSKSGRTTIAAGGMTIEGELNKLAANVAMGRSMGGVHWRTDNTRSLMLGEAIAAKILADITVDCTEEPVFEFRSFSRDASGNPKRIKIHHGMVCVQDSSGNFTAVEPSSGY